MTTDQSASLNRAGRTTVIDARVRLPQDQRRGKVYAAPPRQLQQYDKTLGLSQKINAGTLAQLLDVMQQEGIRHALMHAESEGGEDAQSLNACLCEVLAQHPGRFKGVGAVNVTGHTPGEIGRQADQVQEQGMIGISLQTAFLGMDIDDRVFYPLYARAEENQLTLFLHTGINYSRMHPMHHERPERLDRVACDFPDLRLVACHAGWPWTTELVAVARRHPTVFLEFGGLAPKYVAKPGTGWDAIFGMMPNVLRQQILYSSDYPVMHPQRALAEWRASGLREDTLHALLHDNAARLFGFA